jgi:hypothetical protein
MTIGSSFSVGKRMRLVGAGLLALLAQPCLAQTAACVHIKVGAGFAGRMGVMLNGRPVVGSDKFNIGQTGCVKLPVAGMTDGTPYTVYFSAVFGSQYVNCTPEPPPYQSKKDAKLTYQATGAVRTVHCKR